MEESVTSSASRKGGFNDDLAGRLTEAIVGLIADQQLRDLPQFLDELAGIVVNLPGAALAQVIAFDQDGDFVAAGICGAADEREFTAWTQMRSQAEALARSSMDAWVASEPEGFGFPAPSRLWVLRLQRGVEHPPQGLLVILLPATAGSSPTLTTLAGNAHLLAAAVQAGIRAAAWRRIEQLQQLARRTINRTQPDLFKMVTDLAEIFRANAATLLLWEHGKLRLAASTDFELGRDTHVTYDSGEGLTGHVHAMGRSLRLRDSGDPAEIHSVTSLKRLHPVHPERDREGLIVGPFLGVPLAFAGTVVGVLRLSRRSGTVRFAPEDEAALSFFAELLGAVLAPAWDLLLKRSILASMTEAIAVSRREHLNDGSAASRIVMANAGTAKLLACESLVGREASSIYAPEAYAAIKDCLTAALAEGRTEAGPVASYMLRADGATIPVSISYRFLTNSLVEPPSLYTIGLARDMSEVERQADRHQRLLDLLEVTQIAYFRTDAAGHTVESTPVEAAITGYSREELRSQSRDILYPHSNERDRLLREMEQHGDWLTGWLMQLRRKDGNLFWAACDVRILRDAKGSKVGTEGLYRDVTDRIELQRFLNEDEDRLLPDQELLAALRRESQFHMDYVSSVGHQMQAPLAALVETLRNFEQGVIGAERLAERLPYVIGQVGVCARLVRNFSYMKNILAGAEFELTPVPLARLAVETRSDFSHLLRQRHLQLEIDEDSLRRHLVVSGHRELLRQVFVNLIDNAIKYSYPHSDITIRAREWPDGPALEVSNRGLAIPEQDRSRLFKRGFRSLKAKAIVPHGTGLGLWLVRRIVEAHGAKIAFAEVIEGGQRRNLFRITFMRSRRARGGHRAQWSKRSAGR